MYKLKGKQYSLSTAKKNAILIFLPEFEWAYMTNHAHSLPSRRLNSYSASHNNWCTVGGDGGCRVGEVRAGTTSLMPDHKGFNSFRLHPASRRCTNAAFIAGSCLKAWENEMHSLPDPVSRRAVRKSLIGQNWEFPGIPQIFQPIRDSLLFSSKIIHVKVSLYKCIQIAFKHSSWQRFVSKMAAIVNSSYSDSEFIVFSAGKTLV